ncbi:DinB family protein [Nakamurella leprariae]|uniref:DUF664 domain-containing protein n=1 Tax=Nakamurella leprariae TaxID=2803911 RepID=A0A938YCA0_9ACTN|nr:DinB family protein [Nakamurella leprariae]MBM9465847.1 DUF664 domain-containing protein [Nakamurella leprariae]
MPDPAATPTWTVDLRTRFDDLLDEYRQALQDALADLTEDEARARLVPSRTTLLGLVKHVTYVEAVWFDHAITGRSLREIGVGSTPDSSFVLAEDDTIASVTQAHRRTWARSRAQLAPLQLGDVVHGGKGERTVWALVVQVLRELAQHAGHADILREQVLAARAPSG